MATLYGKVMRYEYIISILLVAVNMHVSVLSVSKFFVAKSGTPLLKDVHIGIPSSGGNLLIKVTDSYVILYLFKIFSFKLVTYNTVFQLMVELYLWFKVRMNTIITFKIVSMTR